MDNAQFQQQLSQQNFVMQPQQSPSNSGGMDASFQNAQMANNQALDSQNIEMYIQNQYLPGNSAAHSDLRMPKNQGAAASRNKAVEISSYMPQNVRKLASKTQMVFDAPILRTGSNAQRSQYDQWKQNQQQQAELLAEGDDGDFRIHNKDLQIPESQPQRIRTSKQRTSAMKGQLNYNASNLPLNQSLASTSKHGYYKENYKHFTDAVSENNQYNDRKTPMARSQFSGHLTQNINKQHQNRLSDMNSGNFLQKRKMSQDKTFGKNINNQSNEQYKAQGSIKNNQQLYFGPGPSDDNDQIAGASGPSARTLQRNMSGFQRTAEMQQQQMNQNLAILAQSQSPSDNSSEFIATRSQLRRNIKQSQEIIEGLVDMPIREQRKSVQRPFSTQNVRGRSRQTSKVGSTQSHLAISNNEMYIQRQQQQKLNQISETFGVGQSNVNNFGQIKRSDGRKSMSHVLLKNIQMQKQKEYKLQIQEQMYTQKLVNIRKILHHQNPAKYKIDQFQQQRNFQDRDVEINIHSQSDQSQLSRLERLNKLKQANHWNDGYASQQAKEDYNQQLLRQSQNFQSQLVHGGDMITPQKYTDHPEQSYDQMYKSAANVTAHDPDQGPDQANNENLAFSSDKNTPMYVNEKKQTVEQYRNLNNINHSNSRERKRQTALQPNLKRKKSSQSRTKQRRKSSPNQNQDLIMNSQSQTQLPRGINNANLTNGRQGYIMEKRHIQTAQARSQGRQAMGAADAQDGGANQDLINQNLMYNKNAKYQAMGAAQRNRIQSSNLVRSTESNRHRKNKSQTQMELQPAELGSGVSIFEDDMMALIKSKRSPNQSAFSPQQIEQMGRGSSKSLKKAGALARKNSKQSSKSKRIGRNNQIGVHTGTLSGMGPEDQVKYAQEYEIKQNHYAKMLDNPRITSDILSNSHNENPKSSAKSDKNPRSVRSKFSRTNVSPSTMVHYHLSNEINNEKLSGSKGSINIMTRTPNQLLKQMPRSSSQQHGMVRYIKSGKSRKKSPYNITREQQKMLSQSSQKSFLSKSGKSETQIYKNRVMSGKMDAGQRASTAYWMQDPGNFNQNQRNVSFGQIKDNKGNEKETYYIKNELKGLRSDIKELQRLSNKHSNQQDYNANGHFGELKNQKISKNGRSKLEKKPKSIKSGKSSSKRQSSSLNAMQSHGMTRSWSRPYPRFNQLIDLKRTLVTPYDASSVTSFKKYKPKPKFASNQSKSSGFTMSIKNRSKKACGRYGRPKTRGGATGGLSQGISQGQLSRYNRSQKSQNSASSGNWNSEHREKEKGHATSKNRTHRNADLKTDQPLLAEDARSDEYGPNEQFPEIRTVYDDLDSTNLIKFLNAADKYSKRNPKRKFMEEDVDFVKPQPINTAIDFGFIRKEMIKNERRHRFEFARNLDRPLRQQIKDNATYGKQVGNPLEKLTFTKNSDLDHKKFHNQFMTTYNRKKLRNFVVLENFREDTKQWRLAYDPYYSDRMMTIYGKQPPQSFKIRQKILQNQINILERYSQVTPVTASRFVIQDETQLTLSDNLKDYYIEKKYLKYVKDQDDLKYIHDDVQYSLNIRPHLTKKNDRNPGPTLERLDEIHNQFMLSVSPSGSRDEVQIGVQQRLQEIQAQAQQYNLLQKSSLLESMDQSDYRARQTFGKNIEDSQDYDTSKIDVDDVYRFKFRQKILSWMNVREDPMAVEDSFIHPPRLQSEAHLQLVYQIYNNWSLAYRHLERVFYPRYVVNINKDMKLKNKDKPIMILETDDQGFKWMEWQRKKKFYYQEHNDFKLLQRFIHHPKFKNGLEMLIPGTQRNTRYSLSWLLRKHAGLPQFIYQQIIQVQRTPESVRAGAINNLHFLHLGFGKHNNDLLKPEDEGVIVQKRPLHPERNFNKLVYRAKMRLLDGVDTNPAMEIFEVNFEFQNDFNDWELMHEALQQKTVERLSEQYLEMQTLCNERQLRRQKKMNRYDKSCREQYKDYVKIQKRKMTRKQSFEFEPVPSYLKKANRSKKEIFQKNGAWFGRMSAMVPFDDDMIPQIKYKHFAKLCDEYQYETPFEAPIKPYMEDIEVEYLEKIMKDYDELFKDQKRKSSLVQKYRDPAEFKEAGDIQGPLSEELAPFEEWIESSFQIRPQDREFDESSKDGSSQIHFKPPGMPELRYGKSPPTKNQIDTDREKDFLRDSSDDEIPVNKMDDSDKNSGEGEQSASSDKNLEKKDSDDKLQEYFQKQLRKEIKQCIQNKDYASVKNYVQAMQGTLRNIINWQDPKNLGNTIIHFAVLALDKSDGLKQTGGQESGQINRPPSQNETPSPAKSRSQKQSIASIGEISSRQYAPQAQLNKLFLPGKQALLAIIKLLISDQAQGQVDIKNDMGLTPIELAERIRNDKDRAQVVATLTKAHGARERRVQAEARIMTKGPKKHPEKSAAQVKSVLESKNSKQ